MTAACSLSMACVHLHAARPSAAATSAVMGGRCSGVACWVLTKSPMHPPFHPGRHSPLHPCSYSPLCTDAGTIRTGIEEGRRLMPSIGPALGPGGPPALPDSTTTILLAPPGLGAAAEARQAA